MPPVALMTDKNAEEIRQLLDTLASLIEVAEDGELLTLAWQNHLAYEIHAFLLARTVNSVKPSLSEEQAGYLAAGVLWEMMESGQVTLEGLMEGLNLLLDHKGIRAINVIAFLNIVPDSAPEAFMIDGTEYKRFTQAALSGGLADETVRKKAEEHNGRAFNDLHRFTPYSYRVTVPNHLAAQGFAFINDELIRPFEMLRSLLNFAYHRRRTTMRVGVQMAPIARFTVSPFFFLMEEDQFLEDFYWELNAPACHFHTLDDGTLEWFHRFEDSLYPAARKKKSLAEHVVQLLLIYQKGLDAVEPEVAYLRFWQVLEGVASPQQEGRGIDTKGIIARLDLLAPLEDSTRKVLRELGQLRHALVHRGDFPVGHGDSTVRIMKFAADQALSHLISFLPKTPMVIDLEQYYNVAAKRNGATLKAIENALRLIQDSQKG